MFSDLLHVFFHELINYYVSVVLKSSVLSVFIGFVYCINSKKQNTFLALLILIFTISQSYLWYQNQIDYVGLLENLRFFIWYFQVIVLIFLFNTQKNFNYSSDSIKQYNKIGIGIIIIVCLAIFLGFLFDFNLFWTYKGSRWGFKGILSKSNRSQSLNFRTLFFVLKS